MIASCPHPRVELRSLRTSEELRACVELQHCTWGPGFSEAVPPSLLKVAQRIGGIAAGAFDSDDRLLGFVFGLTGVENGRLVHWSDMLAVAPEARGRGIGRLLKEYQRATLRALGVEVVLWTFDPLVARNAHLNLTRLGAAVREYICDMYGESDSPLHRGLGTDRFLVAWKIGADASRHDVPAAAEDVGRWAEAPIVNHPTDTATEQPDDLSEVYGHRVLRVEIPCDIHRLQTTSPDSAAAWRRSTRRAFLTAFEHGYAVTGFARDRAAERCFYLLARAPAGPGA